MELYVNYTIHTLSRQFDMHYQTGPFETLQTAREVTKQMRNYGIAECYISREVDETRLFIPPPSLASFDLNKWWQRNP